MKLQWTLFFSIGLLISSAVSANSQTYLHAKNGRRIQVPAELDGSQLSNYFDIKPPEARLGVAPVPPGSALARQLKKNPNATPALAEGAVKLLQRNGDTVIWINHSVRTLSNPIIAACARQNIPVVVDPNNSRRLEIQDTDSTFDRLRRDGPVYQMYLIPQGKATMVQFRAHVNQRLDPKTAERIAKRIAAGLLGQSVRKGIWPLFGKRP